jgi:cytochrome c oxidase cbb3-type subunit III
MCSRSHRALLALALCATGCKREQRQFTELPAASAPVSSVRMSPIQPGVATPELTVDAPYQENAYAMSEGKRLYAFYNCNGCHSNGGGGMGVPLIDDRWIYGYEPENIFDTIVEGRPNGMPAWGSKIPRYQIWQLVSYIRSMSGQVPKDAAPGRTDNMQAKPSEAMTTREKPKQ